MKKQPAASKYLDEARLYAHTEWQRIGGPGLVRFLRRLLMTLKKAFLLAEEPTAGKPYPAEAEDFARKMQPKLADEEHKWTTDFAKTSFEQLHAVFDSLDTKADAIIKYLGGGTALVTLGTIATVTPQNAWLVLLLLPSVCCALVSVRYAVLTRIPTTTTFPPTVKDAYDFAEAYGDKGEAKSA
jgi:hypothetical protein